MAFVHKPKAVSQYRKKSSILLDVDGQYALREGETFNTYEELMDRIAKHSKESMVYYWHRDSRTVEKAYTKTTRPISKSLKYYSLRLACIYSGMKRRVYDSRQSLPKGSHQRTGCPAYVLLHATRCGEKLEVAAVCNIHNHEISELAAKELPQSRKLSKDVKEEVIEMIKMQIERKKIIEYVEVRENKQITSKDLFNLGARIRSTDSGNKDLEKRSNTLQRILSFVKDQAVHSIISNDLASYKMEKYTYYRIENNELVEYISPEHEFGVDETIIEPILEAEQNSRDADVPVTVKPDNGSLATNAMGYEHLETVTTDDTTLVFYDSPLEIDDIKDDMDMLGNQDPNEMVDLPDHLEQLVGNCSLLDDDKSMIESDIIVYEQGTEDLDNTDDFACQYSRSTSPKNYSVVVYETTTEIAPSNVIEEIVGKTEELEPSKPQSLSNKSDKTKVKKLVYRTSKRISKCRQCRTDFRLVQAQIKYLRARRDKLLLETQLLKLKKKIMLERNSVFRIFQKK